MDARHQGSILGEWLRQWNIHLAVFTGGIFQIHLIEHAMLPVLSQQGPVLLTESTTLGYQTVHVGLRGDVFGGKKSTTFS